MYVEIAGHLLQIYTEWKVSICIVVLNIQLALKIVLLHIVAY